MKVLVIDDNPDHRELVIGRVRRAYPDADFEQVIRQAMLDEALSRGGLDLVITDYRLHWSTGLQILKQVREEMPGVPVIMVTDTGSEEVAAAGMKSGLADYVLKDNLNRLAIAVKETLEKAQLRAEHERALERLRISEERHRTISELSSDYAYSYRVDAEGNVTRDWITQAFTRITGYTAEELEAGVLLPLAHPEGRALIERGRKELMAGRTYSTEVRIITKDKKVRWLQDVARPEWDKALNRVVCIYGAGQDITDRKRAEEERAQLIREQIARAEAEANERRYRSLAEAIPQIVWTARPDGQADYYNQRWFEYTGLAQSESNAHEGLMSMMHAEDLESSRERWLRSLETGEIFETECRLRRAVDGSYRWYLCRAVPLRDPDGRMTKWFGTCTDIDEQKRSGEAMREAQKLESIGLLAGGVAHDFNNLLTGILGNASLVLDEMEPASRLRPLVENVVLASERAADLTRQLLAYSGKGKFYVRPVNLSELVCEISSLIQSSIPKKVVLCMELAPHTPKVDADAAQIQQVVMNLVINGAEAIGEDRVGVVTVSTKVVEIDEAFIARNQFVLKAITAGRYVAIRVRDTGCGMEESVRTHIFDPFFTTKFTGRGLGLAAVQGIVRGHKGSIRIETEPGKGTTFEVLLPVAAEQEHEAKPVAEAMTRELRGTGAVLVIDDEDVVRRTARATLERYGYRVLTAENGRDGLELFRSRPDEISTVLLDMMMPVMSGEEALEEILKIRRSVPVIGSSGYSENVAMERFGGHGLSSFLQKPYSAQVLADCVKKVMERGRRAGLSS